MKMHANQYGASLLSKIILTYLSRLCNRLQWFRELRC